ncbi:MAG: sugar phosphate isomerase/epimerase family protein [Isosphaerales bacterium]
MSLHHEDRNWNRREVLTAGCALAGSLGLGRMSRGGNTGSEDPEGPYSPFKMGLQSYSLRGYTQDGRPSLGKALAATKELGLHYWEAFPAHVPMATDANGREALKRELEAAGVTLAGYGVVHLGGNAAANRRTFEFAKSLGLEYLSADPDPGSFDELDKLVEMFDIAVGIHNHGPGNRYAKIETISKAIKDHHPKVGCCIDTGHFLRSKEDPVHAVEAFGNRVFGVHLKDVKDAKTFTILGQGDLRTVDLLKALARNKYRYCLAIEYEEKPEDPQDDIKACLAEAARAIAEVRKA